MAYNQKLLKAKVDLHKAIAAKNIREINRLNALIKHYQRQELKASINANVEIAKDIEKQIAKCEDSTKKNALEKRLSALKKEIAILLQIRI